MTIQPLPNMPEGTYFLTRKGALKFWRNLPTRFLFKKFNKSKIMNIQQVNFKPLFQWINENLGTNAKFAINLDSKRPTIVNVDNLYNEAGIFKAVITEVSVAFFNFDFDEETGKLWGTICLSYESCGWNSMKIGTCWFNPETGWTFESSKERFNVNLLF